MKHFISTLSAVLFLCLFSTQHAKAQSLVITDSTTTRSVCFNTGTITVAATGGTGPYTFSIIGGPSYPNITYPINIPTGTTLFQTIPKGRFTIQVTDAAGHVSTTTATVPGTYDFPTLNTNVVYGCIQNTVSNGHGPFEYSISTIGANAGFNTYQASSSFCGLCDGYYWIRVRDSCGNIFTTSRMQVVIPDPAPSISCNTRDSVIVTLSGYKGGTPYTYSIRNGALSITNHTGIFITPGIRCTPDTVTVSDSCGHVTSTAVNCHAFAATVIADCSTGSAVVEIADGIPPFHITGPGGINISTRQTVLSFNTLPIAPASNSYSFTITDSCGKTTTQVINCEVNPTNGNGGASPPSIGPFITNKCGRGSGVTIEGLGGVCYPLTATCVTCVPQQVVPITASMTTPFNIFSGFTTDSTYLFHFQDTCGFNYFTNYTVFQSKLGIDPPKFFSCNDFSLKPSPDTIYTPPIVYSVYNFTTFLYSSTDTIFNNMNGGSYTIIASQPSCQNDTIYVNTPRFGARCIVPTYDSACNQAYDIFQGGEDFAERFYFVNNATNQRYGETPPGPNDGIYFNDVPAGNYHLISDSGCSVPVVLPAHDTYTLSLVSSVNCNGQSQIAMSVDPQPFSCTSPFFFDYGIYKNGVLIQRDSFSVYYTADTGTYTVKLFYHNTTNFGTLPAYYDTLCPITVGTTYVTNRITPYIVANQTHVCGAARGNIPLTIYGGSAPYTLQIVGIVTQTVNANFDTLRNIPTGIYTMIVSDFCGISTSLSVSVIDDCSTACVIQAGFTLSDSVTCSRGTVTLHNTSQGALTYRWTINGANYSTSTDTVFVPTTPGTYLVKLYAYKGTNCVDSVTHRITVTNGVVLNIGRDTVLCAPFSYVLNSHILNTTWSTGVTDSVITVTTGGTYWAQITGGCGGSRDSIVIGTRPSPVFDLGNDTLLCPGQSLILHAAVNGATFLWSTGVTDSFIVINSQPASNPIRLTVTKGGCSKTDQINVNYTTAPRPFSLGPDTFICGNGPYILNTHVKGTVWSTGVTDSLISVKGPGTIIATITNICGSAADTVVISQRPLPVFSLGNDTLLCPGETLTLHVPLTGVTFQWSTGSTDSFIVISNQLSNPISVSVTDNGCTKVDQINVAYIFPPVPFSLGPDTFFCDAINYTLHVPDATAVWSTGVIDSNITVTAPGTYWAVESNKCGTQTDTVVIGLEHSPTGFDLTATNATLCIGELDTAILNAVVNENQPSVRFIWSTGARDSLIFSTSIAVYDSGTYSVTVDNGKCALTRTINIGQEYCDSDCIVKIAIPNIFSPNGDGKNDTFHVLHLCEFQPFIMHIYNRWGEKIFESHDINVGWDGTYKGKPEPEEIYTYWISMTTEPEKHKAFSRQRVGSVTLVR